MQAKLQRDFGVQPLEHWMNSYGVKNQDLVQLSNNLLSFKQLTRARKGRRLTVSMRLKILTVANSWLQIHHPDAALLCVRDLFNYCS